MTQTIQLPPPARIARWIGAVVLALAVLFVGVRIGQAIFGPGAVMSLRGDLQEVHTTQGTYIGRVVGDDDDYLRLDQPATLTAVPAVEGQTEDQFLVQLLNAEPFGLGTSILVNREHVIFVADVAPESELARAYADSRSGGPESSQPAP